MLEITMEKLSLKEINYKELQKKNIWKEVDVNTKQCILNAGSLRGVVIAQSPQDSLLIIMTKIHIKCSNISVFYIKQVGYVYSPRFGHCNKINDSFMHYIMEKQIKSKSILCSAKK